jgi:hypothetical protein
MIRNILSLAFVGFMAMSCTLFGEKEPQADSAAKPQIKAAWISETVYSYKSGEWELQVEYLLKGTRSEGQDGKLLKDGKPVDSKLLGKEIDTPLGKMKFYGMERKVKWALTGWNFADRRLAKGSARLPAKEEGK